jgi:hypothetical protein
MNPNISDLTLNITEEEYRALSEISYSALSKFASKGPKSIIDKTEEPITDSLRFGSLVDTLLTNPDGIEDYLFIDNSIGDKMKLIIDYLYDILGSSCSSIYLISEDHILGAADKFEYYPKWKPETRLNKIVTPITDDYYRSLASGKIILPTEMFVDAQKCVNELRENPWTQEFFVKNPLRKDIELLYQQKFVHGDTKCMVDIIKIDHTTKQIWLIDLKTTSKPEEEFNDSYYKWNYFVQAGLYLHIVETLCRTHEKLREYQIMPFRFICINKLELAPIVWVVEDDIYNKWLTYKGEEYRPWNTLLAEYKWHKENDKYKYSFCTYSSNGNRTLI